MKGRRVRKPDRGGPAMADTTRKRRRVDALQAVTSLYKLGTLCATPSATYEQCLTAILETAIALTGADKGNIQLLDAQSGVLKIVTQRGFDEPFLTFFKNVASNDASACGAAIKAAERILVEDVSRSDVFAGQPSLTVLLEAGVRAVQSTPLISSAGHVLGMVSTHFSAPHRLTERELRLLDLLARQAADYIERLRHEQELAEKHRLLDLTRDAVVICDPAHRIRYWNKGAEELYGYSAQQAVGAIMHDLLKTELPEDLTTINTRLSKDGHWSGELASWTADGQRILTSSRWVLDRKPDGSPNAILRSSNDITARKLLIDELNHRAKNMLATVQSIASQSLRHAITPAAFVPSFEGRIHALAKAHTLLTDAAWQRADLAAVLHDQLLMDAIEDPRITTSGPVISLPPQLALHMALMAHELGTNARKYGALSLPGGKLFVTWAVEHKSDSQLRLRWVEDAGGKPKMLAASHTGFGMTLIQSIAGPGNARMKSGPHGVEWDIRVSLPPSQNGRPTAGARKRATPDARSFNSQAQLVGKRILIVEDEPLIGLELASIFESAGAVVIGPASSLTAARELLKNQAPDAALLDVNVSGERVDDLAATLVRASIPFAFLTGYGRDALPPAFRATPLIPKPFGADQALTGIAALLTHTSPTVTKLRPKR